MARIFSSQSQLVGNTPLLRLHAFSKGKDFFTVPLAKLELFNPAGSIKDRAALFMIEQAEKEGLLREHGVIIEPTSGNTGIGLASVAASRGYRVILTMPDNMSVERIQMLKAYGAEIILTPAKNGMRGAVDKANELSQLYENSFLPQQFSNKANALSHYETTGPELWQDTDGEIDVLVAGIGSGGTISGAGKFLREKKPEIELIAVEPASSPLLSAGCAGAHEIQGIGANFIPELLSREIITKVIPVSNEDAFSAGRQMATREGILVGISSGAALHAASMLAMQAQYQNKCIVAILPDSGDRYLSSKMFL